MGPVFLNLLLNVVATGQSSTRGYVYATLMLFGLELGTLADNQHFQRTMRAGARPRVACAPLQALAMHGCMWCRQPMQKESMLPAEGAPASRQN